jgi:hypothetical protein
MYFLSFYNRHIVTYTHIGSFLQLLLSILFLYYSFQEGNRLYCFLTGRKGVLYILEDGWKLVFLSHRETTKTKEGYYFYQWIAIMGKKIFFKLNQHFIQSTTTFAQKSLMKYTENLFEICSPNFNYHRGLIQDRGWYGVIEPIIRLFARPTEMSYCFLDSNRLFNSFLVMEMEKYMLQCKINLITLSSTGLIGITMGYRAIKHLCDLNLSISTISTISPISPILLESSLPLPETSSMIVKPRRKTKKEK